MNRSACERRIYRLATLLTGHPIAATRIIDGVVRAQPDLDRIDGAHLDRLTVLRSREISPALLIDDHVPRDVAGVLAKLPAQPREAWIFHRVYRLAPRDVARAMDCSVTATERHLALAEEAFAALPAAADALLEYSMRLDIPEFYREAQQRRRRRRRLLLWAAVAVGLIAIIGVAVWWARAVEGW